MNSYDYQVKVVLVGSPGCGKTNFMSKVCRNQFDIESKSTVGVEFGYRDAVIDANVVRIQIWDTAAIERYSQSYFKNTAGVILLYEITTRDSFDQLQVQNYNFKKKKKYQKWLQYCKKNVNPYASYYLVGTKSDLVNLRDVSKEQGAQFAQLNQMGFEECSSATGENIEKILTEVISNIYQMMFSQEVMVDNPGLQLNQDQIKQKCF